MIMAETKTDVLKVADRCDRCNAQAFVLVNFMEGELYFCGHHFSKHELMLREKGYEIIDERYKINEKGGASA
jgi:hypothetical protein